MNLNSADSSKMRMRLILNQYVGSTLPIQEPFNQLVIVHRNHMSLWIQYLECTSGIYDSAQIILQIGSVNGSGNKLLQIRSPEKIHNLMLNRLITQIQRNSRDNPAKRICFRIFLMSKHFYSELWLQNLNGKFEGGHSSFQGMRSKEQVKGAGVEEREWALSVPWLPW